jgi:hypothetical protein
MIKNLMDSMKKVEPKGSKKSMPKKELVGKQNKLDMNKNGKIDAEDFKMLKK